MTEDSFKPGNIISWREAYWKIIGYLPYGYSCLWWSAHRLRWGQTIYEVPNRNELSRMNITNPLRIVGKLEALIVLGEKI